MLRTVFDPGSKVAQSKDKFPQESPAKKDWDAWFNFWHDYTATGDKLHTPLGAWITPAHRRWIWYYKSSTDDLHRIEKGNVYHYLHTVNYRWTRSSTSYEQVWEEDLLPTFKRGAPTSVLTLTNTKVNKLNEGVPLAKGQLLPTDFWEFLDAWGGTWMWESIDDSQQSKRSQTHSHGSRTARTTGKGQQIHVELDGSYFAAKQGYVWPAHSGRDHQQRVHTVQKCLAYVLYTYLPKRFQSSIRFRSGKLPCAVTTKELSSNLHTPVTGYGPVQCVQIYNEASRQRSTLLRVNLPTCMCMAIWTKISSGTNCHLSSN